MNFGKLNFFPFNSSKANVVLTFSLIILIMMGASFATYTLVSKLQDSKLRESFRALQKNVMDIKLSSHEFILKDRNNVLFFASGKSEHIDHYRDAVKEYHQSFNSFKAQLLEIGFSETNELDALNKRVGEYNTIFREIESGIKE